MLWHLIQFHDAGAVQIRNAAQAVHRRKGRPASSVDEDPFSADVLLSATTQSHPQRSLTRKFGRPKDQLQVRRLLNTFLAAVSKQVHNRPFPLTHLTQVYADRA